MKSARLFYFVTLCAVTVLAVMPNYDPLPELFSLSDKLNHVAAFFVLAALARLSRFRSYRNQLLFLGVYALLIEIIQYFLPTRFFSFADVVADAVGIGLFLILLAFVKRGSLRYV